MSEAKREPQNNMKPSAFTSSSRSPGPPPSAAAQHRLPQRLANGQNVSQSPRAGLARRRSSLLSFSSLDEVRQSLADDLINPSISRPSTMQAEDAVTGWHSTPLAFAILPAVAGLFFKNGTAFITDILLLGLAAIFLNWSIRLPWDWYYASQMQRRGAEMGKIAIHDGEEADETAVESSSSSNDSPKQSAQQSSERVMEPMAADISQREEAAAELRRAEKLALLSTFVFPALAAYLLHIIRAQLSSPSTGLVSDYNLSIFLMCAEIRPCRQLIRLITNRTLHFQRTVTGFHDPLGSAIEEKNVVNKLASRVAELEVRISDHTIVPPNISLAQKNDVSNLDAEMRKRFEPRMEGLERAVRRYEKRSTTLAMLTDQRLGSLDTRLQDALSLAAVAAQQSRSRGIVAKGLESISALITLPLKLAWTVIVGPFLVIEEVYKKLKGILFGPGPVRPSKRGGTRQVGDKEDKGKEKSIMRKNVR